MFGSGHMMDFANRMRQNRSQLKNRKKFKPDSQDFISSEGEHKYFVGPDLSEEELERVKKKYREIARQDRINDRIKITIGMLMFVGVVYWTYLYITG